MTVASDEEAGDGTTDAAAACAPSLRRPAAVCFLQNMAQPSVAEISSRVQGKCVTVRVHMVSQKTILSHADRGQLGPGDGEDGSSRSGGALQNGPVGQEKGDRRHHQ